MADKKVKIHFEVNADTRGAEQAEEALDRVKESAQEASEGFGPLLSGEQGAPPFEEWAEDAGKVKESVSEMQTTIDSVADSLEETKDEQRKLTEAADQTAKSVRNIEAAGKALVGLQFARKIIDDLNSAAESGGQFADELNKIKPALEGAAQGLSMIEAGVGTAIATGNPIIGLFAGIVAGVPSVVKAYGEMRQAQENLAKAPKEYAEQLAFARRAQRELAEDIKREEVLTVLRKETEELERQGRAIQRNNALRNAVNSANVTRAQAEVDIATATGGDVSLAKTNLLSAQLQAQLDSVNGRMEEASKTADVSAQNAQAAFEEAQQLREKWGTGSQEFADAAAKADQAFSQASEAAQDRDATIQGLQAEKSALLSSFQAEFIDLQTQIPAKASQQTEAALTAFNTALATEYGKLSSAIPTVSGAAAAPVVAKVEEVKTGLENERTATAQAIGNIAVSAQSEKVVSDAIRAAGSNVQGAIDRMGGAFISSLQQIEATVSELAWKVRGLSEGQEKLKHEVRTIR